MVTSTSALMLPTSPDTGFTRLVLISLENDFFIFKYFFFEVKIKIVIKLVDQVFHFHHLFRSVMKFSTVLVEPLLKVIGSVIIIRLILI